MAIQCPQANGRPEITGGHAAQRYPPARDRCISGAGAQIDAGRSRAVVSHSALKVGNVT